ncbi:hypothetical protein BEN74_09790 [Acinetobacter sp. WCHAc010034]|nr:hypothetical protein BEN74_09790 [Acinetobacter sp. WCHAc010034]
MQGYALFLCSASRCGEKTYSKRGVFHQPPMPEAGWKPEDAGPEGLKRRLGQPACLECLYLK